MTEEQIAKNMGISRRTLTEWKTDHPPILHAIKKGREVCDFEIENALVQSALDGNVTAQIFYLKNRMPKKWKDRPIDEADEDALKKLREILGAIPSAF